MNALGNTDVLSWITNNSAQEHQYHYTLTKLAINDVHLIPIELIHSKRDSVRKACGHICRWDQYAVYILYQINTYMACTNTDTLSFLQEYEGWNLQNFKNIFLE